MNAAPAVMIVIVGAVTVWILLALPLIYAALVRRIAQRRADELARAQAGLPDPELNAGLQREAAPFGPQTRRELDEIADELRDISGRPTAFERKLRGITK